MKKRLITQALHSACVYAIASHPGSDMATILCDDGYSEDLPLYGAAFHGYIPRPGDYLLQTTTGNRVFVPAAQVREIPVKRIKLCGVDCHTGVAASGCNDYCIGKTNNPPPADPVAPEPDQPFNILPVKITREHLEQKVIASVTYDVRPDGRTTVCELTTVTGYTERGESSAVSVGEFKPDLGQQYSYEDALGKLWAHEGYMLRALRHMAGLA